MKTKKPYLPQTRRLAHKKPPFLPQPRDAHILEAVYDNRFLTFAMLAHLFPPDPDRTPVHRKTATPTRPHTNLARRLGKLFHHHYLDRLRLTYGGELIYAVGQAGADILHSKQLRLFSEKIDWDEKNRNLSQPNIDHALSVARFRVALTAALRSVPALLLDSFQREGKDLKAEWRRNGRRVYVYPDAFFILRDTSRPKDKQRFAFFVEADQSTMDHPRMAEKFERYSQLYASKEHQRHFHVPSFRVLTITKTEARARNLLNLLSNGSGVPAEHRTFFLFTSETSYADDVHTVLSAIWSAADRPDTPRTLVALPRPAAPQR